MRSFEEWLNDLEWDEAEAVYYEQTRPDGTPLTRLVSPVPPRNDRSATEEK